MTSPDMKQPGQTPPDIINGLISSEVPMKGRLALITGSGRELGAETAIYLAGMGAQIIGNYREERGAGGKKKRETDAVKAELGDKIAFVQGDISQPETTQKLTNEILKTGQKLDYLILNASGPSRDTNVIGNGELVDANLPTMNDGGVVVLLQSVPGHFDRQLSGLGRMPKDYLDVAPAKREGEELVRAKVKSFRAENPERDIKLLVVCPPEIPDTQNIRMFDYHSKNDPDGNATQKHQAIARQLGLPIGIWNKREVARKIGDLLVSGDFPSGYTEFFSDLIDSQTLLENWYKPGQVGIQTLERANIFGVDVGIGRSIVSSEQVERSKEPSMVDTLTQDSDGHYNGLVTITPDHARGHLNSDKGLPLIFPGHKQIRAAKECIELIERAAGNSEFSQIKGFERASFELPILADGTHTLTIKPEFLQYKNGGATYNVVIENEAGQVTCRVENMHVSFMDHSTKTLPRDFIIEAAAQTAGAFLVENMGDDILPLFGEVGPVLFHDIDLKASAGVEYLAGGVRTEKGFKSSVYVNTHGESIAEIQNISALVVKRKTAFRMLGYKPQ